MFSAGFFCSSSSSDENDRYCLSSVLSSRFAVDLMASGLSSERDGDLLSRSVQNCTASSV